MKVKVFPDAFFHWRPRDCAEFDFVGAVELVEFVDDAH